MRRLEIACFNLDSARIAATAGVDRIELCDGADVGGTTPDLASHDLDALVRSCSHVIINIMIRPRGGDFVYSSAEISQMRASIIRYKSHAQVSGFVFGILTPAGQVDVVANRDLIDLAGGKPCTFHRAMDEVCNKVEGLEDLILAGFTTVLTSGGKGYAYEHTSVLKDLVQQSGDRIQIMPGGGIRPENIKELYCTLASWFHSSALRVGHDVADLDVIATLQNAIAADL